MVILQLKILNQAIFRRVAQDTTLQTLLEANVSDLGSTFQARIDPVYLYDEATTALRKVLCFFMPSGRKANDILREQTLEFDCYVPAGQEEVAWDVVDRLIELFDGQDLGADGETVFAFELIDSMPLSAGEGFYCYSVRFKFRILERRN